MQTRCLKKAFLSIKGIYYEVEIAGQKIHWVSPYEYTFKDGSNIDYQVMNTFLDFHLTLLGFVLFRLYTHLGLVYPPALDVKKDELGTHLSNVILEPVKLEQEVKLSSTQKPTGERKEADEKLKQELGSMIKKAEEAQAQAEESEKNAADVEESIEADIDGGKGDAKEGGDEQNDMAEFEQKEVGNHTFDGCTVFLSREVPQRAFEFIIRSCGGAVTWAGNSAPVPEDSDAITHCVIDRRAVPAKRSGRDYVQPQWVVDSLNEGRLLPVEEYAPGAKLPPHLSPFVDDYSEGYVPERRKELDEGKPGHDAAADEAQKNVSDEELDDEAAEVKHQNELQKELHRDTKELHVTPKPYFFFFSFLLFCVLLLLLLLNIVFLYVVDINFLSYTT